MGANSLYELIFEKLPPNERKKDDEVDPRIEALELALEMQELKRGGAPWNHPKRKDSGKSEPELI